jgi:transposase-like protein
LRERAVRMVAEVRASHETEWAAMRAVAESLGIGTTETVRKWVRQAEIADGSRPGVSTEESAELKRLSEPVADSVIAKPAPTWWIGQVCSARHPGVGSTPKPFSSSDGEAMVKACGVAVAMLPE